MNQQSAKSDKLGLTIDKKKHSIYIYWIRDIHINRYLVTFQRKVYFDCVKIWYSKIDLILKNLLFINSMLRKKNHFFNFYVE